MIFSNFLKALLLDSILVYKIIKILIRIRNIAIYIRNLKQKCLYTRKIYEYRIIEATAISVYVNVSKASDIDTMVVKTKEVYFTL